MPAGPTPESVERKSFAKVNLLLSVGAAEGAGGARAGWHRICSWMHCIDLADDVGISRAAPGDGTRAEIMWASDAPRTTPIDWRLDEDLGVRAHRAVEAHVGRALPATIRIRKRIPVGAGMGGGSSNAAAVILGLNQLFALQLDEAALCSIGGSIGSDVPFFLDQERTPARPAVVGGFGDEVTRVGGLKDEIVAVFPPYACATPAVYAAFDTLRAEELRREEIERALSHQTGRERQPGPRRQLVEGRVEKMLRQGRVEADLLMNALARPAFLVEPRLGSLVTALANVTRCSAHVTGSGSAVLLFPTPGKSDWVLERARRVSEQLRDQGAEDCTVLRTRLV